MNERIRELAEQAKFMAEEDINRQISYNTELKAFAEKFAELIVRECMSICKKNEYYNVGGEDPETIGHIRAGAMFCREDIKEHFGVEE
jgi:hypothetical protein